MDINKFQSILDFGCGCGRVMRHWSEISGPVFNGCDYNSLLVKECQQSLKFATFKVNSKDSQLDYPDGAFDFVYAISVFTHLSERMQHFWMNELRRIIKPGGFLFLTVHGERELNDLTSEERMQFERGDVVVRNSELSGQNHCATVHPKKYVVEQLGEKMTLVDYIPIGAKDAKQDVYLFKIPQAV